jgi:anaphase-promoting complex subunit 1
MLPFVQMMDGTQINVDVTAPGAVIALALIFMKVCFLP